MRFLLLVVALCLLSGAAQAQQQGVALEPSFGLGLSWPYDNDNDIVASGFHAKLAYAYGVTSYFAVKPYAGLFMTWQDEDDPDPLCKRAAAECESTSQLVLLGGNLRLAAPIPWFAPFIELGAGLMLGVSRTQTLHEHHDASGANYTLPFSLGVALGPRHDVEASFTFYPHNRAEQGLFALMLGFHIPLEDG